MKAQKKNAARLRILHPLQSLGVTAVERGAVRAERLEHRLDPRVPFPHKHDFYQILLLTRGRGWHEIDFQRWPAHGRLFLMKPGQVHSWQLSGAPRGYVIEFTEESLGPAWKDWLNSMPDAVPFPSKLLPRAEEMCSEFSARPQDFEFALHQLLLLLLLDLRRRFPQSGRVKAPTELARFRALVEAHFTREHSVEFYARRLGLSPRALTMRLHRSTGKSARHLIHERILLEAKRLLVQSPDPVAEIGYSLGFEDPNYFARFFRQLAKQSPGKFREGRKAAP